MFFILFLLQAVSDSALNGTPASATVAPKEMNVIDLLLQGGLLMVPLLLMSLAAVYVFVERWMAIKKAARVDEHFMNIIRDNILSGNITAARNFARNADHPVGKMIDKGIQRIGKPIDAIEKSMENVGKLEVYKLERNLGALSIIAGIAPMFGFLGTIVGMIQLFYGITSTGEYTLNTIA
ncbi:MAG: MotA/TolQ/ExbB proton channel family protein, partial [Chitinophagaceae bacterium]